MSDLTWFDTVRVLLIIIFGGCVGESLWLFRKYQGMIHNTRRLLPMHIVTMSIANLGMQALVVYAVAERIGERATWFGILALVFTIMNYAALQMVRKHVSRKSDLHRVISPMLKEPDETP